MDLTGTIDLKLKTSFLGRKLATEPVTQSRSTQECLIEQELWLPLQIPLGVDRLSIGVYDHDTCGDELVGTLTFSLSKLISPAYSGKTHWVDVYGAPLGCSGPNTERMNGDGDEASTWKGRLLMRVECRQDVKNPEMKVLKREQELLPADLKPYELIAEVGAGIGLPAKKKYSVRVQVNEQVVETKKAIE